MFEEKEFDYKPIFFVSTSDKKVSNHTMEWVHSSGTNRWQGWYCAAGMQSLYIDFDGNVFVGTCNVGGWYGNIFRQGLHPGKKLNQWIQCTAKVCACGADMYAAKVKSKNQIPDQIEKLYENVEAESTFSKSEEVKSPDVVVSKGSRRMKMVIWDLSRRCNYACSYCFPDSHNNYEAHKSLGSLKHAVDGLHDWWLLGSLGKFVITGGEPTMNPDYIAFVRYIKSKNPLHLVHTTTNGSRDHNYFRELIVHSALTFSGHMESLSNPRTYDRFVENIRACVETKKTNSLAAVHAIHVRLMLKPGTLDLVERLMADIRSIPDFNELGFVNCDLLHQSGDKAEMIPYTENEKSFVVSSL
ncbi:MAG: radical SAM protein [Bdellovibrionales bacterium]